MTTHVYFFGVVGGGPIKIGSSSTPLSRLSSLSIWSPYPLELLAEAPGAQQQERALHAAFREHWIHREWFKATPEIYAVINTMRETGALPSWVFEWRDKRWPLPRKPMPRTRYQTGLQ